MLEKQREKIKTKMYSMLSMISTTKVLESIGVKPDKELTQKEKKEEPMTNRAVTLGEVLGRLTGEKIAKGIVRESE